MHSDYCVDHMKVMELYQDLTWNYWFGIYLYNLLSKETLAVNVILKFRCLDINLLLSMCLFIKCISQDNMTMSTKHN